MRNILRFSWLVWLGFALASQRLFGFDQNAWAGVIVATPVIAAVNQVVVEKLMPAQEENG